MLAFLTRVKIAQVSGIRMQTNESLDPVLVGKFGTRKMVNERATESWLAMADQFHG